MDEPTNDIEQSSPNTETPDVEKTTDEEIKNAVGKSKFKEKQKKTRKSHIKIISVLAGIGLIGLLISLGLMPHKGSKAFGTCKVFLELNVQYPDTLRLSGVKESANWVRIWYVQTDSFGEYKMERMQCFFKEHPEYGFELEKVTVRRREIEQSKIDSFNRSLPVVFQNLPDLTLPSPLPTNSRSLQFETNMFRKRIF